MTELTEDEIAKLWNSNAGIRGGWTYESVGCKEQLRLTLQDAIAKYAQPSEREIIERERVAFRRGFSEGQTHPVAYWYSFLEAAYPLPKAEPVPVLTEEEVREMVADSRFVWNDVLVRNIERAVLTKLAEQKP